MSEVPENFLFSQSNLQTFAYCRRRFYLRFVKRLVWPAKLHSPEHEQDLRAGTFFHQLIHQHFLGFDQDSLVRQASQDNDPRILQWLSAFLQSGFSRLEGEIFPETSFTIRSGSHLLTAQIDLLQIKTDQHIIIYDWKTSRKLPSVETIKSQFQSQVYPVVIAFRLPLNKYLPISMVYWEANYPDQPIKLSFRESDLQQAKTALVQQMDEICSLQADEFYRTAEIRRCDWCEYRSYCDRGTRPETDLSTDNIHDYEQIIPEGGTEPWG